MDFFLCKQFSYAVFPDISLYRGMRREISTIFMTEVPYFIKQSYNNP